MAKRATAKRSFMDLERSLIQDDMAGHRRIMERLHQLTARFRALHQRGIDALRARDYRTLNHVIGLERTLILRQHALIRRSQEMFQRRLEPRRHSP